MSIGATADLRAIRWVADQRPTALTDIARVVTWLGGSAVLVPLTAVAGLVLERHGLRREAVGVAVSLGGAIVLWRVVKGLVGRGRPPVEHLAHVTGTSFPSGHSTQAGALRQSLVLVAPAAGASRTQTRVLAGVALAIVAIVACSRAYLGVHYPGDVVAGVLLGGGWALFVSRCVGRTGVVA